MIREWLRGVARRRASVGYRACPPSSRGRGTRSAKYPRPPVLCRCGASRHRRRGWCISRRGNGRPGHLPRRQSGAGVPGRAVVRVRVRDPGSMFSFPRCSSRRRSTDKKMKENLRLTGCGNTGSLRGSAAGEPCLRRIPIIPEPIVGDGSPMSDSRPDDALYLFDLEGFKANA